MYDEILGTVVQILCMMKSWERRLDFMLYLYIHVCHVIK